MSIDQKERSVMLRFRDIELEDKALVESYLSVWDINNAEYTFEHIFIWGSDSFVQIAEEDECLYIKLKYQNDKLLLMAPVPKNPDCDYKKAVDKGIEYINANCDTVLFYSVDGVFKELFEKHCPDMELIEHRDSWDYIYSSNDLINLKGKKYHSKRNFINRLKQNYPDFEYRRITEDDYEECMAIFDSWHDAREGKEIDQFDERTSVSRAIKNMKALGLFGGAIFIDGNMKAFSVGGFVNKNMGHIHIEKAVDGIDGLFPAINQLFAADYYKDVEFINREEDMGIPGLRKAKESYYPVKMTEKYLAAIKDRCTCEVFLKEANCEHSKIEIRF